MKYEVRVQLKKDVLNVEAKEILSAIKSQDFSKLTSIETAKLFTLEIEGTEESSLQDALRVAKEILTNEVIENYSITRVS